MGMFMLAAAIPLTYVYYMMQVTDPLNMLVFFLAFWAMRERRDALAGAAGRDRHAQSRSRRC